MIVLIEELVEEANNIELDLVDDDSFGGHRFLVAISDLLTTGAPSFPASCLTIYQALKHY